MPCAPFTLFPLKLYVSAFRFTVYDGDDDWHANKWRREDSINLMKINKNNTTSNRHNLLDVAGRFVWCIVV